MIWMIYEEVSEALRAHPGAITGSGAGEAEIAQAERDLGVVFPDSYRRFLLEFGWVNMDDSVSLGLGSDVPVGLHLVRQTLEHWRERLQLTDAQVPILDDDIGLFCLDLTRNSAGDCPVVCYFEYDPDAIRNWSESFLGWLWEWIWQGRG